MSKAAPSTGIDPVILARFLVMPGVEPLLDAFGRIPPGPMRDSVIHLARTLADQYSAAPAGQGMPDPLLTAAGFIVTPPPAKEAGRLAGPVASAPAVKPKDDLPENLQGPEADVIRRRKKGQHPQQIQAEMSGLSRAHIDRIIAEAKKAGITFPNIRGPKGRPLESKIWHTSLDTMRGQGLSRVKAAADARGVTPGEYLRRKLLAVEMAMNGAQYPEMMRATDVDMKTISLWLSNARAAGLKVPYTGRLADHGQEPAPAVPAVTARPKPENALAPPPSAAAAGSNVIRPSRFFGPFSAVGPRQASIVARAAARRNLTPDAYLDLQESIVRQRMNGLNPMTIATNTGADPIFIKDALQAAKEKGAIYPPCPKGWSVKTATG